MTLPPTRLALVAAGVILGVLVATNPNEAQYRGYVSERQGIVGVLGMGLIDLLSKDGGRGLHRDNYLIFSKFYIGGDGLLPRQDVAWGMLGKFWEIEPADDHPHKAKKR